ncbi:hypothetical protein BP5796_08976 [Coleophoma crateriformis]|uniref:Uncharacterized protein n=1 Tax=Coleophoma crateriformis TaxID=565419 RepID=A0A3D8R2Q9_9HELO|nr:hypothetical protein BP5796_08976 [Coleophoma crateriformis]
MRSLAPIIVVALLALQVSAQTTYYTLLFSLASAGSQYGVTRFESTMVAPAVSTGSGSHSAWPGLEPESESFVYQNVLIDSGNQWYFFTEYCCSPNVDYAPQLTYPGDTIKSVFDLDTCSGEWTNTWSRTPGSTGSAAGETAGTTVSTNSFPSENTLSQAVFAIELQNSAAWDFGAVVWSDITITANTTDTTWCTSPETFGSFQYSMSSPVATVSGSSSTCFVANLIFESP